MLTTVLTVVEIVYVVVLAVWIILEKRPPLATLAWIFSLAWLPVVGFFVFWFIGPTHIRRKRSKRRIAFRRLSASPPDLSVLSGNPPGIPTIEPKKRQLMALALNSGEAPLTAGNTVTLLRNGAEKFPAIEEAIRAAQHHVHLAYYIFAEDEIGRRIRDLLIEKAKQGVHVRLLLDAVGSLELKRKFLKPFLDAGGEIAWFNVVTFPRLRPVWNFRNHRKIIVCDAKVGFLGGLNIADEYAGLDPELGAWRDTHMRVTGPAVRALQMIFTEDWHFAGGKHLTEKAYFVRPEEDGQEIVQILASGPDGRWPSMQHLFFSLIAGAEDRLQITTPYFVPDEALMTALIAAALRGVDVQLLLPKKSDARLVAVVGRSYYDELLRAGVRIFEYLGGVLHAKTISVDGRVCVVGSANMDQRSLRLNFEVGAVMYSDRLATELEQMFELDLTLSREVTLEERQELRFPQKLAEASARLLSPLL